MELIIILAVCLWAAYMIYGHVTKGFKKNSGCNGCKNCQFSDSCNDPKNIEERSPEDE